MRHHPHFNSEDVFARVRLREAMAAIAAAFLAMREGRIAPPVSLGLAVAEGTYHVKACAGTDFFVAKVNANYPANPARGLPTIQGIVAVFDAADGRLLATLDSPAVTCLRTAATTAIAIECLARDGSRTATLVGCGALGRLHLEALAAVGLSRVDVFDRDRARATELATWAEATLGIACRAVEDMAAAALAADVVVTCTTSPVPFLGVEDVRPGTLVAAVGADSERKSEIDSALLARARIVTDATEQCRKIGDLRNAAPGEAWVCGDLAEAVAGRVARTGRGEIVVFDSTGLALEDLAVCALVLR